MSKRTITKTFYISDVDLKDILEDEHLDDCEDILLNTKKELHYTNKITISFEAPEREVTIKESKFGEIIGEYPLDTNEVSSLIEKLFGAEK